MCRTSFCSYWVTWRKYDLDGIILDRCRYDDYGLESDFSAVSKQKFEEYIGETVAHFPEDIMAPGTDEIPSDQPAYFKKWLEFRVKVIHTLRQGT